MTTHDSIRSKVMTALQPVYLDVINESHQHNVPANSETHFKLVIVSESFDGQALVKRHRTLNALLADELGGGVHALSLHTHTPAEWQARGGQVAQSPNCLGGDGSLPGRADQVE